MTRVPRTASCGIEPDPNEMPSSVRLFCVVRCPATAKLAPVESLAPTPTTPGASAARVFRSFASTGNRDCWSAVKVRSWPPGAARSIPCCCGRRACTLTAARFCGPWFTVILKLFSRRSSSPCRVTITVCGATPIARTVIRYWPPPSGKRIV